MPLPVGGTPPDAEETAPETSRTYLLNTTDNRIGGMVDEVEALRQAIYKILLTTRFGYFIYSGNYGAEQLTDVEMSDRITEALLQDDRIESVENFQASFEGDSATVSFTVRSVFGNFQAEQEVVINDV